MKRILLSVAMAALAVVPAVACAPGQVDHPADLEVFAPYRGAAADRLSASLVPFEEANGVEVRVVGSTDFPAELRRRVNDAQPPDVAVIPQPGLVTELTDSGAIVLPDDTVLRAIEEHLLPEAQRLGAAGGRILGVPYRLSPKSLVWYSPAVFADHGWVPPTTLDELRVLTDRIAGTDIAPWCFGIEAGSSTGWVVTDWVEDVLLRQAGPAVYDRWVRGEIDFTDDDVAAAFAYVDDVLLTQGHVLGNTSGIVRTPVDEAILPMLATPPACALHRNATFTTDWLPEGTAIGPEESLDVFVLPPASGTGPAPLLTGLDTAVAMTDDPLTQELLAYLTTPEASSGWAASGGFLGAHDRLDGYDNEFDLRMAHLLDGAEVVRVDGSDQMEPAFGEGAFWDLARQWASGLVPTDEVLVDLDAARAGGR